MSIICEELRESVELFAILNTLYTHRNDYIIGLRVSSLLEHRDRFIEIIADVCGLETAEKYRKAIENPGNDKLVTDILSLLHNCMIKNGCESNVLLEK